MEENNKSILIIPDVHGRKFWKEGLKKRLPGEKVIFLGDYTDPYPCDWEVVDRSEIPGMIKEILETPDAIFLLGNHDLSYVLDNSPKVRYDYTRASELRTLFLTEWDKFRLSYYDPSIGPAGVLFSHAGFLKSLYHHYQGGKYGLPEISEYFEHKKNNGEDLGELMKVSWFRGGYDKEGSFVWADVREHLREDNLFYSRTYQIFGHTQLKLGKLIVRPKYAMIDCKRPIRFIPDPKSNKRHKFEVL